jgi:hypothetical protein
MRRLILTLAFLLLLLGLATPVAATDSSSIQKLRVSPLVDSLAGVGTDTSFSVFGSAGPSLSSNQLLGPRVVLSRRTLITEIGGYLNNCLDFVDGVANCPDLQPFTVQIRPATAAGLPDPNIVLATYRLTDDGDPLRVSFESASMHLSLRAGTYFALFGPLRSEDQGFLLSSAQDPFLFASDSILYGYFRDGVPYVEESGIAVRIMGRAAGN